MLRQEIQQKHSRGCSTRWGLARHEIKIRGTEKWVHTFLDLFRSVYPRYQPVKGKQKYLIFSCLRQLNTCCCSHHISTTQTYWSCSCETYPCEVASALFVGGLVPMSSVAGCPFLPGPDILSSALRIQLVVLAGLRGTAGLSTISTRQSLFHKACKLYTHSHWKHHSNCQGSLWPQLSVNHAPRATFWDTSPPYHAQTRRV